MKTLASLLCLAAIAGNLVVGPSVLAQEKPTPTKSAAMKAPAKKVAKKMKHKGVGKSKKVAAKSAGKMVPTAKK
jgi:hypothetical protein